MITITKIADSIARYIAEDNFTDAHNEWYADDVVSIEPESLPNHIVQGREALAEKGKKWESMVDEVVSIHVSEPEVADNFFTMVIRMKAKMKGIPGVIESSEVAVYEVKDNKIIKEQFFYDASKMG